MQTKEVYKKKMEAQLEKTDAQINLLVAQAENAKADLKLKFSHEVDQVKRKQREVVKKLKDLEQASNETWEKVKVAVDQTWDDLKNTVNNAVSKFK